MSKQSNINRVACVLALFALLCFAPALSLAANLYVTPTGAGDGSITSPTALSTALSSATLGDTIHIEEGTYLSPVGGFQFTTASLTVLGGYDAGSTFTVRNAAANPSILSGNNANRAARIYRASDSSFDGVTFAFGLVNSGGVGGGGALFEECTRILLTNCVISTNTVSGTNQRGGGISFRDTRTATDTQGMGATFVDCLIASNRAQNDRGGAMFIMESNTVNGAGATRIPLTDIKFIGCKITNNTASTGAMASFMSGGGAAIDTNVSLIFDSCMIDNNRSAGQGGIIHTAANISTLTFVNSDMVGNWSTANGMVRLEAARYFTMINNTYAYNNANQYQIWVGGNSSQSLRLLVLNNIFARNWSRSTATRFFQNSGMDAPDRLVDHNLFFNYFNDSEVARQTRRAGIYASYPPVVFRADPVFVDAASSVETTIANFITSNTQLTASSPFLDRALMDVIPFYEPLTIDKEDVVRPLLAGGLPGTGVGNDLGAFELAAVSGPAIDVTPGLAVNYGNIGFTSGTQDVSLTVENIGDAAATITSITLISGSADFSVPAFPANLNAGTTGALVVRYIPGSTPGYTSGTFLVTTNDFRGTTFTIFADATLLDPPAPPTALLVLPYTSYDFGSVAEDAAPVPLSVLLTNAGGTTLTISSVTRVSGDSEFTVVNFPTSLGAGQTGNLDVLLTPVDDSLGAKIAGIRIICSDPVGTYNLALTANITLVMPLKWYVSVTGAGDGTIANPTSLVNALASAVSGEIIHMEEGVYNAPAGGFQISTVTLTLKGGYALGSGFSVRDSGVYPTVLSGQNTTRVARVYRSANTRIEGVSFKNGLFVAAPGVNDGGAGILFEESAGVVFEDCVISDNVSSGTTLAGATPVLGYGRGGGILFRDNRPAGSGGLGATFINCDITNNRSPRGQGGAIFYVDRAGAERFVDRGDIRFIGCRITNNSVGGNGAMMQYTNVVTNNTVGADTSFLFDTCLIKDNTTSGPALVYPIAGMNGQGPVIDTRSNLTTLTFVNNVVEGNYAVGNGIFRISACEYFTKVNNTVVNNSTANNYTIWVGGTATESKRGLCVNNVMAGNVIRGTIYRYYGDPANNGFSQADLLISNNIDFHTYTYDPAGLARMSVARGIYASITPVRYQGNPLFAGSTYQLSPGSPAIDKAIQGTVPFYTALTADFVGQIRPLDGDGDGLRVNDLGAYEVVGPTSVNTNAWTLY
jgi:hypothetical protein